MLSESDNINICKVVYSILEECARVRFTADKLLSSLPYERVQLI